MINTRRTYNLIEFLVLRFSNKSNGARFGINNKARNSN